MPAEGEGITLALGGLGMRGALNIGVLRAVDTLGIKVKGLRATGISTVVVAYYALGRDPGDLLPRFFKFFSENRRALWGLEAYGGLPLGRKLAAARSLAYFLREALFCQVNFSRISVFPWDQVLPSLHDLFGDAHSRDLRIPLAVGAVDLKGGREQVVREGALVKLVQVGIAFPGLFPPVEFGGSLLVSSALFREIPLAELSEEERPVVAVRARRSLPRPRSLLEVMARADELRERALTEIALEEADLVLELTGLDRFSWARVRDLDLFVDKVRKQVEEALRPLLRIA